MELFYRPLFEQWYCQLLDEWEEIAGEVMALLSALEEFGADLGGPFSHPVKMSDCRLRALRRTPPTEVTPYAEDPPVLRILYGFAAASDGIRAVVLYGGDKTELGNQWYPAAVAEAERRFVTLCGQKRWRS